MAQTTVQHSETIRFGSAKFEMGANVGALVNVGAIRNAAFEYTYDKVQTKSDNAGIIRQAVMNERAALSGDLMEINATNLGSFYSGVLTAGTTAGALVPVADETQVLTGTIENVLTHKNGDGTEVTAIVVTNAAGSTIYLRDVDYVINVNANGYTTIARAYPAAVATAEGDIDGANADSSYNDASGNLATILAPGDHIIVSGFTAPATANNGVKTVSSATGSKIVVTEAVITKAAGDHITITRGGIATGDTTLVDYNYTPSTGKTLKGGGLVTFTARVCRFTNTNAADKTFVITIFNSTPDGGITINFPADDAEDPALCPIKMVGTCDTTLIAGEQLFTWTDSQHTT